MKTSSLLFSFVLAIGMAVLGPAEAKNFMLGDPPVAVLNIPDSWSPTASEDEGVEANAPGGLYFAAEPVEITDVATATRDGIAYFQQQGITLDQSTMKQTETKVGGFEAIDVSWKGKDSDGPTNVGLTFVILSPKQSVLIYLWATDEQVVAAAGELESIVQSLKVVER